MKIAVLDDYQNAVAKLGCNALLQAHDVSVFTQTMNEDQLAAALQDFDALVLIRERTEITASLLARLPRLKLISQTGKVSGHIDVEAATAAGVAIAEGVGDPTAPAELTWALIMAAYRKIPQYVAHMKAGRWQASSLQAQHNTPGRSLHGDTLGIWSYGKLGRRVAGYGKAFGMQVVIWGSEPSRIKAQQDGYAAAASQESFFAHSDVLSLHLRLNAETQHIVQGQDLALMKPTALLVNTARAELIAPDALVTALQRGRPGLAAIDVFESEPILQGQSLLRMENCICTPHIGYVEQDSYELYFGAAFNNVRNFAQGTPSNILNPEAAPR